MSQHCIQPSLTTLIHTLPQEEAISKELTTTIIPKLELLATQARKRALQMVEQVHSGHLGGSLSVMDILAALYGSVLRVNTDNPKDPDRDRLVLSKGHCTPALYTMLAMRGFFHEDMLSEFRQIHGRLSGHAEMTKVPGVDMSTGSLGQGLFVAVGMALAGKLDNKQYDVWCICGDGECQEGQIWEAAQTAVHYNLEHLTCIVDNNHIQLDGRTADIGGQPHYAAKFAAFGWKVLEIDGNDMSEVLAALHAAQQAQCPVAIIADTRKGKGVSFMENDVQWHGKCPNRQQFIQAYAELDQRIAAQLQQCAS